VSGLHGKAKESFSKRFEEFLGNISEGSSKEGRPKIINNDLHLSGTIKFDPNLNKRLVRRQVVEGKLVSFEFVSFQGQLLQVDEECFLPVINLLEKLFMRKEIKVHVTYEDLEDYIVEWMCDKHDKVTEDDFIDFLDRKLEEQLKEYHFGFPINGMSVVKKVTFEQITISNLLKSEVDEMERLLSRNSKVEGVVQRFVIDIRKRFQGKAVAKVSSYGTKRKAEEISRTKLEKILSFMSLFSKGAFLVDSPTIFNLEGMEYLQKKYYFELDEGKITKIEDGAFERNIDSFIIDDFIIQGMEQFGKRTFCSILSAADNSQFEATYVNSVLIFAHGVRQKTYQEKLLYILTSIELLLLKNSKEHIVTNVSKRFAFLAAPDKQNEVRGLFEYCYKVRSDFIHHFIKRSDSEKVQHLLVYCHSFFSKTLLCTKYYKSKDSFIEKYIEPNLVGVLNE